MNVIFFLLLGFFGALLLLRFAHTKDRELSFQILSKSLLIAALIYVAFALIWGDSQWVMIEMLGVIAYGFFIKLSKIYSLNWLALGWLLHPAWDAALHLYGPAQSLAPTWYAVACISFDVVIAIYIFYVTRYRLPRH